MNNKNKHWSLEEPWMIRQAKNMKQNIAVEEFEQLSKNINDSFHYDDWWEKNKSLFYYNEWTEKQQKELDLSVKYFNDWWERQQKESEQSFKIHPDKRKYFF
jgi:hypothetical protein